MKNSPTPMADELRSLLGALEARLTDEEMKAYKEVNMKDIVTEGFYAGAVAALALLSKGREPDVLAELLQRFGGAL